MSIVLNENEWAEYAIANRQLGRAPMETLGRVARYYCQSQGYQKREVRALLEDFLLQCDPGVTLVKWSDALDRLTKTADRYPLVELDGIDVTHSELETVGELDKPQLQRLAFTLLCVAKYWNAVREQNNGWVNTADREIMRLANINTSIKRQSLMLHDLRERGLVRFSRRVDNLNIQVRFIQTNSPVKLRVIDVRSLGNQYMLYRGGPYIQCAQCGLTMRKRSNVHKYCPDCAAEIYIKKSVESVMRQRVAV